MIYEAKIMTFISVGILKIEENSDIVKYAFGNPPHNVLGHVIIYKIDGRIELIDIIDKKYEKYILPCVKKKLRLHYENKEFPDQTSYHS